MSPPRPIRRRSLLRGTAILGSTFLAASLAACGGEGVLLADGGRPQATITWWGGATPAFAATELARYVGQITGATLPLRGATSGPAGGGVAIVAQGQLRPSAPLPARWLDGARRLTDPSRDAFRIDTSGDKAVVIAGSNPRSVLFGVYDLLERLGVRFFAPSFNFYQGYAEQVPRQSHLATLALGLLQTASLQYRRLYVEEGWSHTAENLPQLIDWMAKAKLNILVYPYNYDGLGITMYDTFRGVIAPALALALRGLSVEVGGHGFQSWLPQTQYPEYYEGGYNVFDTADPAAAQQYVQAVSAYLRGRPEIRIFDAWPPDSGTWPPNALRPYDGNVPTALGALIRQLTAALGPSGVAVEEIAYGDAITPWHPGRCMGRATSSTSPTTTAATPCRSPMRHRPRTRTT